MGDQFLTKLIFDFEPKKFIFMDMKYDFKTLAFLKKLRQVIEIFNNHPSEKLTSINVKKQSSPSFLFQIFLSREFHQVRTQ